MTILDQRSCKNCNEPFSTHISFKKYCSKECCLKYLAKLRPKQFQPKPCRNCGKVTLLHFGQKSDCSAECNEAYRLANYQCKIHGKIDKELIRICRRDIVRLECRICNTDKSKAQTAELKKDPNFKWKSKKTPKLEKLCKNCKGLFEGFDRDDYCCKECSLVERFDNFECKKHGKIPDKKKHVNNTKFMYYISCALCESDRFKRKNRERGGIKVKSCLNCALQFTPLIALSTKYCSLDCNRIYFYKTFECKAHGKIPNKEKYFHVSDTDNYENKTSSGCRLCHLKSALKWKHKNLRSLDEFGDLIDVMAVNVWIKRKVRDIKGEQKALKEFNKKGVNNEHDGPNNGQSEA